MKRKGVRNRMSSFRCGRGGRWAALVWAGVALSGLGLARAHPKSVNEPLREILPAGLFKSGNGSVHSTDGKKLGILPLPIR